MKRVTTKYNDLLNRLYLVVSKITDVDVLIDKTAKEVIVQIKSTKTLDKEIPDELSKAAKGCGLTKIRCKKLSSKGVEMRLSREEADGS